MNLDEPAPEVDPPYDTTIAVCTISLIGIPWVAKSVVTKIDGWWMEGLIAYALIPIAITFIILYRSRWHLERVGVARTLSLILLSSFIFCGVFIFFGAMLLAVGVICVRFTAFHY